MEATKKQNQERVNRVNNRVSFSNGDLRRPQYAVLLPNGHSVLCRAGANMGLTALISRKEADRKGVNYLRPLKWAYTDLFVYPNNEVRDEKGKFLGTYLGQDQDDFCRPFISTSDFGGTMHDIFVQMDKGIYCIDCFGEKKQLDAISLVIRRMHWGSYERLAKQGDGDGESDGEKVENLINSLAAFSPAALHAALQLQEIRQFNPPTAEELEKKAQKKRSRRCQTLAYDYLLQLSDNCPVAEDCESLWFRLSEMTDEQLDRFERGEMSKEELNWAPKEGWSAFVDTPLVGVGEGTSLFPNPKKRKIRRQRTAEEEAAIAAAFMEETPEAPAEA